MYDMFNEVVERWLPTKQIDVGKTFARTSVTIEPDKIISIPIVSRTIPSITPDKVIVPSYQQTQPPIAVVQPSDYTPYAIGASKPGLISQDGLAKRKATTTMVPGALGYERHLERRKEAQLIAPLLRPFKKTGDYTDYPSGTKKPGITSQVGLTKRGIDSAVIKSQGSVNIGFLAYVDRFFIWLNGVLGD